MRRALLALLALLPTLSLAAFEDDWFDPAFLEANSFQGATGFILVPSPEVLPGGAVSGSIHRYQIKLGYGALHWFELGVTADLDGYDFARDWSRNQLLFGRVRLLSQERQGIGLSVGVDGIGMEDLGLGQYGFLPKAGLEELERVYATAGGSLPFYPSLMLVAGYGSGAMGGHAFGGIYKVLVPGLMAMAEYDGFGTNFGTRYLLSPRIKLDLAFVNAQDTDSRKPFARVLERNIRFGVSYSEPWTFDTSFFKRSPKKNATPQATKKAGGD